MKKYCVALYSNFDGSMNMDVVYADSQLDACKQFLMSEDNHTEEDLKHLMTYDQMQQYVFDQDHAIGAMALNESPAINYDGQAAGNSYPQ